MIILGLNVYHGDSSASLLKDGETLCAFEEERFTRFKHWAGFPLNSIKSCLKEANITIDKVDFITVSRDPNYNIFKKTLFLLKNPKSISNFIQRFRNRKHISNLSLDFTNNFDISKVDIERKIKNVEHHNSHLASAFFASDFKESAILSIDAFGDFSSTVLAIGKGNKINKIEEVNFPHSVGQFYTAITQFLGFHYYGDEYKIMGLAPYGKAVYMKEVSKILKLTDDGLFKLDLKYFTHHTKGVQTKIFENNDPTPSLFFSDKLEELFGKKRDPKSDLTQKHKDIAASVQLHCENVIFHLLNNLYSKTKIDNLCIAGGVAQNSVANGKISSNTNFKNIYIPPAGHDAGTSIGSALFYYNQVMNKPRFKAMFNPYLGSKSNNRDIENLLISKKIEYIKYKDNDLIDETAKLLFEGKVVGWFQGNAEFGPRALGGRSILVDPRRNDAKKLLNAKIKKRESFRPFAPSILEEFVSQYFEIDDKAPFMEKVLPIKTNMQIKIPAVTHVDGTGRLQTVNKINSPKYYALINSFYKLSGVPILLNTSFNENEPIVNIPEEALNCFLRTEMDVLVLENFIISR
tara:strand:- start:7832 stop:9559 length:1728 start_codon:yes stop_codon:yes gene_type:complete